MPPKKAAAVAKEHNVYLVTHHKISDGDEIGHMKIYQAHATLDEANASAEARAKSLCGSMQVDSPDMNESNFTKDGNFHIQVELSTGSFTVEVVTVPVLGGLITPAKKPPVKAAKKAAAPKKKAQPPSDDDEEEEEDEDEDFDDEIEEPVKPVATNGKKRKAPTPDDNGQSISEHDIHAAPSGAANCLDGESFLVTGTLEDWTRDEIHALIKKFGGTCEKTLKASLSYVVVGSKPGQKKLDEIASKNLKIISQTGLYQHIRDSPGGETIASEEVARTCRNAKGRTNAAAKAAKAARTK